MRFFNRYAYAFNNPYKFDDPDGRCPLPGSSLCGKSFETIVAQSGHSDDLRPRPADPAVVGSGWTRPSNHPYVVGREGTSIQPGNIEQGGRGEMLDNNVPGMHTMGTLHDALVDAAVANGVPDQLANKPTMGGAYAVAVAAETVNTSVGIVNSVLGTNISKPFEHSHDQTLQEQAKPVPEKKKAIE